MKDNLQMFLNYLYSVRERQEHGDKYGDTDEIIKMYEKDLGIKKDPVKDSFEEVSTDIIKAISDIHYEDKEKEIIRLNIQYVLCKMTMTKKQFEEDIKLLDMRRK